MWKNSRIDITEINKILENMLEEKFKPKSFDELNLMIKSLPGSIQVGLEEKTDFFFFIKQDSELIHCGYKSPFNLVYHKLVSKPNIEDAIFELFNWIIKNKFLSAYWIDRWLKIYNSLNKQNEKS